MIPTSLARSLSRCRREYCLGGSVTCGRPSDGFVIDMSMLSSDASRGHAFVHVIPLIPLYGRSSYTWFDPAALPLSFPAAKMKSGPAFANASRLLHIQRVLVPTVPLSARLVSFSPHLHSRCFTHILSNIRITFPSILRALRIWTQRPLSQDFVLQCIIVPPCSYDLIRSRAILRPSHQGEKSIVVCVAEARDAVDGGVEVGGLVGAGEVPTETKKRWSVGRGT